MLRPIFALGGKPSVMDWLLLHRASTVLDNAAAATARTEYGAYDDAPAAAARLAAAIGRPDVPPAFVEALLPLLRVRPSDRASLAEAAAHPHWREALASFWDPPPLGSGVWGAWGAWREAAPSDVGGVGRSDELEADRVVFDAAAPPVVAAPPPPATPSPSRRHIVQRLSRRLSSRAHSAIVLDAVHLYDDVFASLEVAAAEELACMAACACLVRKLHDVEPLGVGLGAPRVEMPKESGASGQPPSTAGLAMRAARRSVLSTAWKVAMAVIMRARSASYPAPPASAAPSISDEAPPSSSPCPSIAYSTRHRFSSSTRYRRSMSVVVSSPAACAADTPKRAAASSAIVRPSPPATVQRSRMTATTASSVPLSVSAASVTPSPSRPSECSSACGVRVPSLMAPRIR